MRQLVGIGIIVRKSRQIYAKIEEFLTSQNYLIFRKFSFNMMDFFPFLDNNNISTTTIATSPINNYIGPDELCLRETRLKFCNLHTPKRLCICYTPIELMRQDMPFCSRLFPLDTLEHLVLLPNFLRIIPTRIFAHQILTISLAFPMPQSFLLDPDSIFAEDLELFAGFQRNSVFIVRKGCDLTRTSFQFQFGILKPGSQEKTAELSARDFRRIWPKLFMANANFMGQKGLLVESVTQSRYLRPLIGYKEWIYADKLAEPGLGICRKADPVECYGWEMAFLFLLGIYLGAEFTRAMLWRIFRCRHERPPAGEGQRIDGRRQSKNGGEEENIGLVELASSSRGQNDDSEEVEGGIEVVEVEVERRELENDEMKIYE